MRIVIAPNSFKHCLSSPAVAAAVARGVRAAAPDAELELIPLSDGGDGLLAALSARLPGRVVEAETEDALGRPLRAAWFKHRDFALIETALACGQARLSGPGEYAPLRASTLGAGLLVRAALDQGCRRIVIGLGGSATVDAGCGLAAALGYGLLDAHGQALAPGGGVLGQLDRIIPDWRAQGEGKGGVAAAAGVDGATFIALTDVRNPLLGPSGAARVFGPQKGASPAEVEVLESNLTHWARVAERDLGRSVAALPGAGAAGGLGAGCAAFLGARLTPGAEWVAERTGLREAVSRADLVLTGEGRLDRQTGFGKVPGYVARLAREMGKPVLALAGSVEDGLDLAALGIARCAVIAPPGAGLAESIKMAETNLEKKAAALMLGGWR